MKDKTYLKILGSSLEKLEDNDTDIIFFQAGVDGLVHDTLGHLSLSHQGMMKRNEMVLSFCKKKRCPVVIFMGGGYSKDLKVIIDAHANTYRVAKNLFI